MTNSDDGKGEADKFRELGFDGDPETLKAKLRDLARSTKLEHVPIAAMSPSKPRQKPP
jgi:hypothetical protein